MHLQVKRSNSSKTANASKFKPSASSQISADKSYLRSNPESPLYIKPSQILSAVSLQAKLTINQPNDRYEKEADAVADRTMRIEEHGEAPVHGAAPGIQRKCTECEKEEEELQLKKSENSPANPGLNTVSPSFSSRLRNSRGTGNPLPAPTLLSMNHAFGIPLNQVRIHTDTESIRMNRSLNARAFTNGSDIYFNQGEYNPASEKGKRLLAHELTHVVQQAGEKSVIQRQLCEDVPPPNSLACEPANSSPTGISLDLSFEIEQSTLSAEAIAAIANFVNNWHASGTNETVRVDGFASCDGSASFNWPLSCSRARTLENELKNPSGGEPGIPANFIETFANGETDQFGPDLQSNRRATATISGSPVVPPPVIPPVPPVVPPRRVTKVVTIDAVRLHGSNHDPATDLAVANRAFARCNVRFRLVKNKLATQAQTKSWLRGNTDLQRTHSCSAVHPEENSLRVNATSTFSLSSRYKVFYVQSMTPALNGVNFSPDCSSGARAPFNRHLYVSNSGNTRTLAHELGHIPIVGLSDHTTHGGGPDNLMIPNGPGSALTPRQCREVFSNI